MSESEGGKENKKIGIEGNKETVKINKEKKRERKVDGGTYRGR